MELVEQLRMRAEWRDEIDVGTRDLLDDAADALTTLQAREATLIRALDAISEGHPPDQPASSGLDEREWLAQHIRRLRRIAREALATSDLAED